MRKEQAGWEAINFLLLIIFLGCIDTLKYNKKVGLSPKLFAPIDEGQYGVESRGTSVEICDLFCQVITLHGVRMVDEVNLVD
ncbi:hypothetical protein AV530_014565 [Patagioenas fasciata monilis]|uniref:Uncharacterized protein n=1 Tax=Patagioenas fasciata monilis TaxID=372326 RepID=A0A1V4KDW9_PATFA|nr:hypothetical protein AV530_014565 [Patagioenas fasciata monilis]